MTIILGHSSTPLKFCHHKKPKTRTIRLLHLIQVACAGLCFHDRQQYAHFRNEQRRSRFKAFVEVGKIKKLNQKKTSILKLRTEGSVALPLIENSIENTSIITNIWDDILKVCEEIHSVLIE